MMALRLVGALRQPWFLLGAIRWLGNKRDDFIRFLGMGRDASDCVAGMDVVEMIRPTIWFLVAFSLMLMVGKSFAATFSPVIYNQGGLVRVSQPGGGSAWWAATVS